MIAQLAGFCIYRSLARYMRPNRSRLALTFIGNEISMSSTMTKENRVLKVVLAILLPPLAVFLERAGNSVCTECHPHSHWLLDYRNRPRLVRCVVVGISNECCETGRKQ